MERAESRAIRADNKNENVEQRSILLQRACLLSCMHAWMHHSKWRGEGRGRDGVGWRGYLSPSSPATFRQRAHGFASLSTRQGATGKKENERERRERGQRAVKLTLFLFPARSLPLFFLFSFSSSLLLFFLVRSTNLSLVSPCLHLILFAFLLDLSISLFR